MASRCALGQSAPDLAPTPIQTCIANWEKSRQPVLTRGSDRLGMTVTNRLIRELLQRSDLSASQMRGCGYVYALLDRVRLGSQQFTIGRVELTLGEGGRQRVQEGDFELSGDRLEAAVSVASHVTSFAGSVKDDLFEGSISIDRHTQRLLMKSSSSSDTAGLRQQWVGTLLKGPQGLGKNVPVSARFFEIKIAPLGMGDYIDGVLLGPGGGAHFGGPDLEKEIARGFDRTLAGLAYWSQRLWKAASGLVSVDSESKEKLPVVLDGTAIGQTPFTFPVAASVEHKLAVKRGPISLIDRIVILKDGEFLAISVP